MKKPTVIILGKLPPPFMGPSIATNIILNSKLNNDFNLIHLDTRAYETLQEFGEFNIRKLRKNIAIYWKLLSLILKNKPDLVLIPISQTTSGFLKDSPFILITALTGTKSLLQLRGSDFKRWYNESNKIIKIYIRFVLSKSNGVIVLGNKLRDLFGDFFTDEKIFVVPNGGNYNIPPKSKHGKKIELLHLSNLHAPKGIEDIIDALILLKEEAPDADFHLTAIGNWIREDSKERCLQKTKQFNLPVTFLGQEKSKDKLQLLSDADLFLFPPRDPEGHPWVLIEAMAAGLPIISTDRGAITESVINNVNGFIVETASPVELAKRIKQLLLDSDLRDSMGKQSRKFYEEKFTEEIMTDNLKNVFNSIIHQHATAYATA